MKKLKMFLAAVFLLPWGLGIAIISCLSCGDPPIPPEPEIVLDEATCRAVCGKSNREMTAFIPSDGLLVICSCADQNASYTEDEAIGPLECSESCVEHGGVEAYVIVRGACLCASP